MEMKAFHNDAKIKAKYIARVVAHRRADQLVQGTGWENGKGCAVGCTLESYDHSRYPIELGLPEWLARLEDYIFEALPKDQAMQWPAKFLRAIPVGANVEPVRHKLAIRRLDRLIVLQQGMLGKHGASIDAVLNQTVQAIGDAKALHHAEADGKTCDWSAAWSAAESAAWSAAESAESAAWSAAWSAAESAAWSAAWSAAESAAWSARSAAESAARSARSARSAAIRQEAEDLIELLKAA